MRPCRVCGKSVIPWKGQRRPHTTIHKACRYQRCRFCGVVFLVGKERRVQFCCSAHHHSFRYYGRSADEACA